VKLAQLVHLGGEGVGCGDCCGLCWLSAVVVAKACGHEGGGCEGGEVLGFHGVFSLWLSGAKVKKMSVSVLVLDVCGGGCILDAVGGFFADLVRSFGAADICAVGWRVFDSFHLVALVVVAATNWPRRVTVARS
jgi:hypothetical protein